MHTEEIARFKSLVSAHRTVESEVPTIRDVVSCICDVDSIRPVQCRYMYEHVSKRGNALDSLHLVTVGYSI